jgi:sugar O-acyltransferase (sialic acid O-acetyltransferase NeuD family)
MQNIIIIGSGGHAVSCIDVVLSTKKFRIQGYISNKPNLDLPKSIKWLGDDKYLKKIKKNQNILIGFANIGKKNLDKKIKIFKKLKKIGCKLPYIISKNSYVSKSSKIGCGTIIMHNVVINANVKIGENCIINTNSLIEHDCSIGNHTHVSTGVIVNGNCKIFEKSFLGTRSVIFNNLECKDRVIKGGEIVRK